MDEKYIFTAVLLNRIFLALLLAANGYIITSNKFDEKPMAIFTRMATLLKPLINISALRVYADNITFCLGIIYYSLAFATLFLKKIGLPTVVTISFLTAFTVDNPLFSEPQYFKTLSLLTHIFIAAIALEHLRIIREEEKAADYDNFARIKID